MGSERLRNLIRNAINSYNNWISKKEDIINNRNYSKTELTGVFYNKLRTALEDYKFNDVEKSGLPKNLFFPTDLIIEFLDETNYIKSFEIMRPGSYIAKNRFTILCELQENCVDIVNTSTFLEMEQYEIENTVNSIKSFKI